MVIMKWHIMLLIVGMQKFILHMYFFFLFFFFIPFNSFFHFHFQKKKGWIECVGCADRSCYDLEKHEETTRKGLFAQERLEEPITKEETIVETNMGIIGKQFKQKGKLIKEHLSSLSQSDAKELGEKLKAG